MPLLPWPVTPIPAKTTLFNDLTGARQHVGNYPGVTVEKKEGVYRLNGHRFNIVDLPGTYSLTAYSLEEVVARDFLTQEKAGSGDQHHRCEQPGTQSLSDLAVYRDANALCASR